MANLCRGLPGPTPSAQRGGARGGCRTCRAQASREEGAGQGLGPEILSQTLKGRFVLFSFCTIYFLYYIVNMYIKMHI